MNSVALYNVIELTLILWCYFKRHSGLYFWSFLVATYGIAVASTGFLIKFKAPQAGGYLYVTFIAVGWAAMMTGQSMVLWSRLHLILWDKTILRLVLYMIIFDAITMLVPTIIMAYGANSDNPDPWAKPYSIYEKIQVSVFFIQELIISSLYIRETVKLARLQSAIRNGRKWRPPMIRLIAINVIIILLDITILGLEYANYYNIQTAYKALVYSIKLKMEFTILNRLKEMATAQEDFSSGLFTNSDTRHQQTAAVTGIEMASFSREHPFPDPVPAVSRQTYAQGGNISRELEGHKNGRKCNGENEVVITTEVVVCRESRQESNMDRGGAGFDSFATGSGKMKDSEGISKSPSERV
ncbi:hypothetical protein B0J13DRAFT_490244 [Dactylonectria estremocensis]|uniref:DUF7703 domain-containing protein n=1 Tax=Dactylonectria estremocensis TaxID=1079267 RepID=A0A9P9CY12_9HYPO|nr:hypothetical protein B0J13DRAFT_490244 [Dactylonectria estremocensis]